LAANVRDVFASITRLKPLRLRCFAAIVRDGSLKLQNTCFRYPIVTQQPKGEKITMTITDVGVRNLRPGETRREVPAGNNLYVVVHETGRKSYAVRYRFNGQPRKLTLAGGITLKAARKLAADALFEVEQGRDPAGTKRAAKVKAAAAKADTFQAICEEYFAREGDGLRTLAQRERAFRRLVYPAIGAVPINNLSRSQIVRLYDHIEDNHGKRIASLTFAYVRRVLNWHAPRTDDFKSPIVQGMDRYSVKDHARDRILGDDEIRAVWQATETKTPFGWLTRFLLLTGSRYGEAAGLTRAEVADGTWNLPAARNKTKQNLPRPLSKAALAIVEAQPRIGDGPLVFSNDGFHRLSPGKPKRLLDKNSGVASWTLHDLRRTSRTLLSRAGISVDVSERCIGHVIGGVRAVYDKHKFQAEMAAAFESLALLVERIVNPPEGSNVRQLRQG
jgi:integrase